MNRKLFWQILIIYKTSYYDRFILESLYSLMHRLFFFFLILFNKLEKKLILFELFNRNLKNS